MSDILKLHHKPSIFGLRYVLLWRCSRSLCQNLDHRLSLGFSNGNRLGRDLKI